MRITLNYLTPLLVAGAAAAAIATAPAALAAPTAAANPPKAQESCIELNTGSQCESPGNVQLNDSPAGPIYPYYGDYPFYGGYYDGFHDGFHGGYGGGFRAGGGGHR